MSTRSSFIHSKWTTKTVANEQIRKTLLQKNEERVKYSLTERRPTMSRSSYAMTAVQQTNCKRKKHERSPMCVCMCVSMCACVCIAGVGVSEPNPFLGSIVISLVAC